MTLAEVNKEIDRWMTHFTKRLGLEGIVSRRKDCRGGRAGMAYYKGRTGLGEVAFNALMFAESGTVEDIKNTVAHELCHIVVARDRHTHPALKTAHGVRWRETMWSMGIEPERTHNLPIPETQKRKSTRYQYQCPECNKQFSLSKILHNRIKKGRNRICPICRKRIFFTGAVLEN